MFFLILAENKDVIKEDCCEFSMILKSSFHRSVERGRGICKTKRHYKVFIKSKCSLESCFMNIFGYNAYLMVTALKVYVTKDVSFFQVIKYVIYLRNRKSVLDSLLV